MATYACQNCGFTTHNVADLCAVTNLSARLLPGEPCPDGVECPECGALVREVKAPTRARKKQDAREFAMELRIAADYAQHAENALRRAWKVLERNPDPGARWGSSALFVHLSGPLHEVLQQAETAASVAEAIEDELE